MSFAYYRSLTVDHTQCGGSDSSSFPVLVFFSDLSLATVANGGHVQKSDGSDILFFADSTGVTQLPSEMESGTYNPATGTGWAWVQLNVTHSTNAVFYVLYGNASPPARTTNPWDSNFSGVWHFGSPSVLSLNDSTTNANNGSSVGSPAASAGKIGGAISLNGTSQAVDVGSGSSQNTGNIFTIEAWVNQTAINARFGVYTTRSSNDPGAWQIETGTDGVAANGYVALTGLGTFIAATAGGQLSTSTWAHIAATKNGSGDTSLIYVNGVSISLSRHAAYTVIDNARDKFIGEGNAGGQFFNGLIDELRLSNNVRSADWILTEYNNQNVPGNIGNPGFLTWGPEQLSLLVEDKITPGSITSRIDAGDINFGGM